MLNPGVGTDLFSRGEGPGGGFGPRAQGVSGGVDFGTQKLTKFDKNSKFKPILGLNHTKLVLI